MTVLEANIEVEIGAYSNTYYTEIVSDDGIITAAVSLPPSPSLNLSISRPEKLMKINKKFHKVSVSTPKFCPKMSYLHRTE